MNEITEIKEHHLAYSAIARAQIIEHVLEQIVLGERGLARILREDEGMCSARTFYTWMFDDPDLAAEVERAREIAATARLEDTFEIAEDVVLDKDAIAKAKLRIYQREMFAAKIAPKRFGSKVDVTSGGEALKPTQLTSNKLEAIVGVVASRKAKEIEDQSDETSG